MTFQSLGKLNNERWSVSGSDSFRLHDYEVALREVLKLRKNLKREDWQFIGAHISNRDREGKESEVLWNNRPLTTKKVRKEVLRNRKTRGLVPRYSELILFVFHLPYPSASTQSNRNSWATGRHNNQNTSWLTIRGTTCHEPTCRTPIGFAAHHFCVVSWNAKCHSCRFIQQWRSNRAS